MTRSEFVAFVKEKQEELIQILSSKGDEYAIEQSAFWNFEEGYKISTCKTPEEYAWNLMCKHLQSIKDIINSRDYADKDRLIQEKFADSSNYIFLIWAMIYEKSIPQNRAAHGIIG